MIEKKQKILVVDDLPHWRKLISNILIDYDVYVTETYDEAIKLIEQVEFDVAVLDIRLEDNSVWNVDGIDILKNIKEKQRNVRVIILTGYRESARDQILRDYQPHAIINKESFDNTDFKKTVQILAAQTN